MTVFTKIKILFQLSGGQPVSMTHHRERSEIHVATFTLEEVERMADVATRAAIARLEKKQEPSTARAGSPNGEDALNVNGEAVNEARPKAQMVVARRA
jgi:hypothetical protein